MQLHLQYGANVWKIYIVLDCGGGYFFTFLTAIITAKTYHRKWFAI